MSLEYQTKENILFIHLYCIVYCKNCVGAKSILIDLFESKFDLLRLPGPPAKFAIAIAMRCFASCAPEYPLDNPKSTVRFELEKLLMD